MAIETDGVDQYINCGSSSLLDVGSADFATMLWFRAGGINQGIFSKGRDVSTGAPGWFYRVGPTSIIVVAFSDGTGGLDLIGSSMTVTDDVLRHVAIVRDGGAGLYRLYVNGVEDGTTAISLASGSLNNSDDMLIGSVHNPGGSPSQFLDGAGDDARFYPRLVIAKEILTVYSAGQTAGHDGIVAPTRYLLNEGAPGVAASGAGILKDIGANRLDATPVNSPIWVPSELSFRRRAR